MNQPLAYVHPGAKIAKNVVIEPFTTINNNVVTSLSRQFEFEVCGGGRLAKGQSILLPFTYS